MSVALDFDNLSSKYTEVITRWLPDYYEMLAGIIHSLPRTFQPERILDIGCGNGNLTALLLQAFPDAKYTLVDASPEMLAVCRARFAQSPIESYQEAWIQDLAFEPETFDLITAAFSIHHLEGPDKKAFFKKANSWLGPGCWISMCDLYINKRDDDHEAMLADWKERAMAAGTTEDDWDWIMKHYDAYDRPDNFEDQFSWMQEAGFRGPMINWRKGHWGVVSAGKEGIWLTSVERACDLE